MQQLLSSSSPVKQGRCLKEELKLLVADCISSFQTRSCIQGNSIRNIWPGYWLWNSTQVAHKISRD